MQNSTKKYTAIVIGIVIVLVFGTFWLVTSKQVETPVSPDGAPRVFQKDEEKPKEQPSGKIDEHLTIDNTLRDVNFCGKIYKVKQVIIDGVDVVQRIATFARENKKVNAYPQYKGTGEICEKIQKVYKEQSELKITHQNYGQIEGGDYVYSLTFNDDLSFIISASRNEISEEVSGPEFPDPGLFGVFVPIGTLK